MYSNTNNSNQQTQERFAPGYYTMKAKTKARQGLDGKANRGILITDGVNEQWITIPTTNEVCRLPFGSKVYYHGHNARPSLTFGKGQANSPTFDNGGVMPQTNQALADYYSRLAEQEATQEKPHYYNQSDSYQPEPNTNTDVDETLIERLGVLYSNCVNLAQSLNPQLDTDNQTKIAISMAIQYSKIKDSTGF